MWCGVFRLDDSNHEYTGYVHSVAEIIASAHRISNGQPQWNDQKNTFVKAMHSLDSLTPFSKQINA